MAYLMPAGQNVANRKLSGYYARRRRGLGLAPVLRNGGGAGGGGYRALPISQIRVVGPKIACQLAAPPVGCTYVPDPDPTNRCGVKLFCPPVPVESPITERLFCSKAPQMMPRPGCRLEPYVPPDPCGFLKEVCPPSAVESPVAGTPVPAGFPINQLFVATDGSQYIYSATQGRWIYVGIPYSVGAPSALRTTTSTPAATGAPATPPIVTTAPPPSSGVLDWLKQTSLADSIGVGVAVPNWAVVGIGGALFMKLSWSNAAGGRR